MSQEPRPENQVASGVVEAVVDAKYDEDAALLDRFLEGDEAAFRKIYERHYERVFMIAKGILLDADEASDAVQEIFTLVFRKADKFDRRARFSTWLFRIAVNRSIQQARKIKNKRNQVPLDEAMEEPADESVMRPTVQEEADLESALEKMSPSDRAILTLFYWDDRSLQEIGEALGCSANAAKTRLFRARERFKTQFEQGGEAL